MGAFAGQTADWWEWKKTYEMPEMEKSAKALAEATMEGVKVSVVGSMVEPYKKALKELQEEKVKIGADTAPAVASVNAFLKGVSGASASVTIYANVVSRGGGGGYDYGGYGDIYGGYGGGDLGGWGDYGDWGRLLPYGNIYGLMGFQSGLNYVPYNNFVAKLHEGERILTKAENVAYTQGQQQFTYNDQKTINISGGDPKELERVLKDHDREFIAMLDKRTVRQMRGL